MNEQIARLTDIITQLTGINETLALNDTVEFDINQHIAAVEATTDVLDTAVNDTTDLVRDTSES